MREADFEVLLHLVERLSDEQRTALGRALASASHALLQKRVASSMRLVCRRLAAAAPTPRALPATALAPLSHRLRSGFFFVHGFAIASSSQDRAAP